MGAPSSEAAFWKAEMPGRTSMVMPDGEPSGTVAVTFDEEAPGTVAVTFDGETSGVVAVRSCCI